MWHEKLASFILLPAVVLAQNPHLSEAARKLVNKPRLGLAQLTLSDGRTQEGRIRRVTDEFVALETNPRPNKLCENIARSRVAELRWLPTPGTNPTAKDAGAAVLIGAFLGIAYAENAVSNPFRRIAPPLNPPRGSWELRGSSRDSFTSSLEFKRNTVEYRTTTRKRGGWSVERNLLRLKIDGEPDRLTPFRFDCGELILDNPASRLTDIGNHKHAVAPLVGEWHGSNYGLTLEANGNAIEQGWSVRKGTFETNKASVKMRWSDSGGAGGPEWIAEIKDRYILVSIGGVLMKYHYVPPGIQLDL